MDQSAGKEELNLDDYDLKNPSKATPEQHILP